MKVFTLGKGFVSEHLSYPVIGERIFLDKEFISNILNKYNPDILINCIGKTGRPNIDACEDCKEEVAEINTALPILLANVCLKKGIRLIQINSGCIFYGESKNVTKNIWNPVKLNYDKICGADYGWKETDFANPKSFYSKTKYACDLAIGDMSNVTILRIRMPISNRNNPRNFINKIRGYKQIIDIPNSVTFMDDLVRCIDWFSKNDLYGIYHVTNPEPLTAVTVMKEYQKYVNHEFEIISEEELDKITKAKRSNCIINCDKLNSSGFQMTPTEEILDKCMREYIKNLEQSSI